MKVEKKKVNKNEKLKKLAAQMREIAQNSEYIDNLSFKTCLDRFLNYLALMNCSVIILWKLLNIQI